MKTSKFVLFLILVLAVLIIAGSCAPDKMANISKDFEIYGAWVNPDYNKTGVQAKVVIWPNGKMDWYNRETDTLVVLPTVFAITNKWIDSEENIWYTLICKIGAEDWDYRLVKISDSGKTLECAYSPDDYPKVIDIQDSRYRYEIRYRHGKGIPARWS